MFWRFMFIGFLLPTAYASEVAAPIAEKKFGIKTPDFKIEP